MKQTDNMDSVSMLESIGKAAAPPFLLTRIKQRIANGNIRQYVSPRWVAVASLSFVLLLMVNVYVLKGYENKSNVKSNLAQAMNLYPNNSLY